MNRERLYQFLELANECFANTGFQCIETEWNQHDKILRIFVDHQDGVDLDACAKANRLIGEDGRVEEQMPESSALEVSSPGIERPLRRLKDFELYIGSIANVRLVNAYEGKKSFSGRIISANKEGLISVETDETEVEFPVDKVLKARLVFDWKNN